MINKYLAISQSFVHELLKKAEITNQDNFRIGSDEYTNFVAGKLEFELQKNELILKYLDVLEAKVNYTQQVANSLIGKTETDPTD